MDDKPKKTVSESSTNADQKDRSGSETSSGDMLKKEVDSPTNKENEKSEVVSTSDKPLVPVDDQTVSRETIDAHAKEKQNLAQFLDVLGIDDLRSVKRYITQLRASNLLTLGFEALIATKSKDEVYQRLIDNVVLVARDLEVPIDQSSFVEYDREIGTIVYQYKLHGGTSDVGVKILRREGNLVGEMYRRKLNRSLEPYLVLDDVASPEAIAIVPDSVDILLHHNEPPILSIAVFPVFKGDDLVGTFGIDYYHHVPLSSNRQLLDFCYTLANFAGVVLELRQSESEKAAAEALALFGDVASNIAHFMNGKLSAIGLQASDLKVAEGKNEVTDIAESITTDVQSGLDYIKRISSEIDRLISKPEMQLTKVQDVVMKLRDSLQTKFDSEQVNFEVNAPSAEVFVNFPFLDRVIELLLLNAITSIEKGKQGTVKLDIQTDKQNKYVVDFFISDNGRGVAEADKDKLFTFGYSTSKTGLGWGLWMANQQLARFGSTLQLVKTDPIQGTTFKFTLPVHDSKIK